VQALHWNLDFATLAVQGTAQLQSGFPYGGTAVLHSSCLLPYRSENACVCRRLGAYSPWREMRCPFKELAHFAGLIDTVPWGIIPASSTVSVPAQASGSARKVPHDLSSETRIAEPQCRY